MNPEAFLREQKVLRLVTTDGRGVPHVVPVWYMFDEKIYVGTNRSTKKARNLAHTSHVAFCVDVGVNSPDIMGVMGRGTARLVSDGTVRGIAERILMRYFESMENASARELLDDTDCIIEITPTGYSSWSY